jgi:hydrogenase nickel incorporation protein HypB
VLRNVLDTNDLIATENRKEFDAHGCFVINVMGTPGSGKTALLERTFDLLNGQLRVGIIEGDIQTSLDAERLARFGAPVVQINTDPLFGAECHLDARMIRNALPALTLDGLDLVLIENVGNLVCPAEFWVGEDRKVMVMSVTEGEDKPLKYPLMFRVSDLLLLNKVDLLSHLDLDVGRLLANVAQVNPNLPVIRVSARRGEGCKEWVSWLLAQRARDRKGAGHGVPTAS